MDEFKNNIDSLKNNIENAENGTAVSESEPVDVLNQDSVPGGDERFGDFKTDDADYVGDIEDSEEQNKNSFVSGVTNTNSSGWSTVDYSPVAAEDKGQSKRGIGIFSLILAAVIVISGCCIGGYYMGKNSIKGFGSTVDVDLAAKPKNTDEYTAVQVYEMVNESVVGVRVYNSAGSASDASGVFYSDDGYIVTNDHIYSEIAAPKFKIYMYDGTEYDATYVAGDSISDLAVLKVDGKGFKPAEFGDSRQVVFGENVVAVGRPNDATESSAISKGIISAVSRRMVTTSSYSTNFIQTDSAINPGSSGGALVNMYGQVVGITSSKLAGVDYEAIGFAIPTVTMKRVVEQLISGGSVTDRAKLGISYTEINSVSAEISDFDTTGLLIADVTKDSDLYGKVSAGAIITHINGIKITNDNIVLDILESSKAGDTVTLTIKSKNGASKDFSVKLKANIGQSSYSSNLKESDDSSSSPGGAFDFPFGE